jgi:hypothetical protein
MRRAAASALALLAGSALGFAAQAEPASNAASDPCASVRARPDPVPDLQQGLERLCRLAWGSPPEGSDEKEPRLRIALGGWADASYRDDDIARSSAAFELDHVNLHLDARIDERWQLFAEGEYEHEPGPPDVRDEREFELEQLYLQHSFGDLFNLRAGQFSNPFGYWTPIHWSILMDTIEAPLHEQNRLVPEQLLGLRLFGRSFPGELLGLDAEVDYSLHTGYASDELDTGNGEGINGGADLRLWLADRHLLGASFYAQRNGEEGDRAEESGVAYAVIGLPFRLLLRGEYMHQWRQEAGPRAANDLDVLYAALRWDFVSRAYLHYRFSYGDDDRYGFTTEQRTHTLTLGVRPWPRVLAKFEVSAHDYEDRSLDNYLAWAASLGVMF